MGIADILVFVVFVVAVIAIGLWKSRGEEIHSEHGAQDYFLAGRGLTWWLVGFSLIAANISTEQFVGMSGKAADWLGMAIASYEWMAAITLVVVAFLFLPKFLKSGIYTIPEFLEYRYNTFARTVMAIATLVILVGVPTASVIYSGAKVITVNFQGTSVLGLDLGSITVGCWIIGVLAAVYVFAGGLKACAWADLIQGSALVVGGAIIAYIAMKTLGNADPTALAATATGSVDPDTLAGAGAIERLKLLNAGDWSVGKLHMVKPADDPEIPWTALVVGLWIPNFFYWGLNQYITQRTLGSKSLAEGQRGVVFAAFLKLLIPFVVVIPGILAFNLFNTDLKEEAIRKNAVTIEKFVAKEKLVFPFTPNFAELNSELAVEISLHNASLVGPEKSINLEGLKGLDASQLAQANMTFVDTADEAGLKAATKLVGYDYDAAFPTLIRGLLPTGSGLKGFVLAAIFGAVVSSLASMLNSSSTIFTMDIYRKLHKNATQFRLVSVGRICVVVFVLIACVIAPILDNPGFGGIFTFIQEFQGFISPGILAIFLFGVLVHRAPRSCGTVGLLLNPLLYGGFKWAAWLVAHTIGVDAAPRVYAYAQTLSGIAFLNRMAICFFIVLCVLAVMRLVNPMPKPVDLPVNEKMNLETRTDVKVWGGLVIVATLVLYAVFW